MIKYEYNTLVLDSSQTKDDKVAIDDFIAKAIETERDRIYNELDHYNNQYDTLQIAKFKIKQIVYNTDRIY
jgi:hypothetical protein